MAAAMKFRIPGEGVDHDAAETAPRPRVSVEQSGAMFALRQREASLAAREIRLSSIDREERAIVEAKCAVKRKAEELRAKESSLQTREAELNIRLRLLEQRILEMRMGEASLSRRR